MAAEQAFVFRGIISGTVKHSSAGRSLTHLLDYTERQLAVKATQDQLPFPVCGANDALIRRLLDGSERSSEGCLRWTGTHSAKGYGKIYVGNRRYRPVHVVAHEIWIGPVPEGLEVDHVHARGCRHRDCIEPAHLEAVTHAENLRRVAELRTHCPKGHEFTPGNIKWTSGGKQRGRYRGCRRCFNDERRAWRAQKRRSSASTAGTRGLTMDRPDWRPSWPEVPEGHEVVAIIDPDWDVAEPGHSCMWRGGAYFSDRCDGEAVAILLRINGRRWRYCSKHLYGRWVESGFVMHWILAKVGSDAGT